VTTSPPSCVSAVAGPCSRPSCLPMPARSRVTVVKSSRTGQASIASSSASTSRCRSSGMLALPDSVQLAEARVAELSVTMRQTHVGGHKLVELHLCRGDCRRRISAAAVVSGGATGGTQNSGGSSRLVLANLSRLSSASVKFPVASSNR
jgi:hypothetical protein